VALFETLSCARWGIIGPVNQSYRLFFLDGGGKGANDLIALRIENQSYRTL